MQKYDLYKKYQEEVKKSLKKEFDIKNDHSIPKISKIVVNSGIGALHKNKEGIKQAQEDIAVITGQSASVRNAKLSVASFGIREGAPVGLKVTLRGKRMYDFMGRLISYVFPRIRDFRGISRKSFDNEGKKEFYDNISVYNYDFRHEYAVYKEYEQAFGDGKLDEYHQWILGLRKEEKETASEKTLKLIENDTKIRESVYKKLKEGGKHHFLRDAVDTSS